MFTDGNLFEALTNGSVDLLGVMRLITCIGLSSYSLLMFGPVVGLLSYQIDVTSRGMTTNEELKRVWQSSRNVFAGTRSQNLLSFFSRPSVSSLVWKQHREVPGTSSEFYMRENDYDEEDMPLV